MRPDDPQLTIELEHDVVEVGGRLVGHIRRAPLDGTRNEGTFGTVREVRVALKMVTEGRGDTDTRRLEAVSATVDEYGIASQPFALTVPMDAAISYDGALIRVRWMIEARTDRKLAIDSKIEADVLVVPVGGRELYDRPHPLR